MSFAVIGNMAITRQLTQYAGHRLTKRLYRSIPWIGAFFALATIGGAIRRKGLVGGTIDTALDFTPYVGGAKNLVEAGRGRDFIPDRRSANEHRTS
jgi:hypothetical protein